MLNQGEPVWGMLCLRIKSMIAARNQDHRGSMTMKGIEIKTNVMTEEDITIIDMILETEIETSLIHIVVIVHVHVIEIMKTGRDLVLGHQTGGNMIKNNDCVTFCCYILCTTTIIL